ncbi:DUF2304 domain-containing protein [Pedobacter frigiditerrae]|uniref:DUF2304 domain-containing protein n=1 Tax=Pedobacter frigiditerrae TaxID=2530452 RepID=A0A4R0MU44_9SPHI|nr:DUF2304 domain-containing protein [Pedobacter frigiditerrae]TCC90600.1 DUF2304 domain-containing protein [Pedobacter frigiditerrae]
MITSIQLLLIICILAIGAYFYSKFNASRLAVVIGVLIITICGTLIFFPYTTTRLANLLGAGRGVDMLFYFSFLLLFFIVIKLFSKIRKQQEQITEIVRKESIKDVKNPKGPLNRME